MGAIRRGPESTRFVKYFPHSRFIYTDPDLKIDFLSVQGGGSLKKKRRKEKNRKVNKGQARARRYEARGLGRTTPSFRYLEVSR